MRPMRVVEGECVVLESRWVSHTGCHALHLDDTRCVSVHLSRVERAAAHRHLDRRHAPVGLDVPESRPQQVGVASSAGKKMMLLGKPSIIPISADLSWRVPTGVNGCVVSDLLL